ncbi:MAG: phosphoglucosamine mutase [Bacteroidia bacterium]|nr:phosphoglucosamine mutase [Bacteroidia bacterium]HQU99809.1 phosphoglucosamine mutase [Bacteroidia bacterium]
MTLIKSISGIRGTIGGQPGNSLTPVDVVKYTAAFATILKNKHNQTCKVVLGRDARISGLMLENLIGATLISMGIDVINLGLTTTPTTEMAVVHHKAQGGIILTASHNPKQWNALKLLNEKGEFISAADGEWLLNIAEKGKFDFTDVNSLGKIQKDNDALQRHITAIINLPMVDAALIGSKKFKVVVDAINSSGAIAVPQLLSALGVEALVINGETNGHFAHNPEPLPEHLHEIAQKVVKESAHAGIVVDPDVDRLAFVCENGEMFGEEYTLVAVANHMLQYEVGNTVSNLSSTRALRDVTEKAGGKYFAAAVGEVNVVSMMKAQNAIIGGEGNGGIIVPQLHYGRDAMVGIALFLTHLAKTGKSCSMLRSAFPDYHISKNKIELTEDIDVDAVLTYIADRYSQYQVNQIDGVKIDFEKEWIHLRKSNTEPIIRIYAESSSMTTANNLAQKIITDIKEFIQQTA